MCSKKISYKNSMCRPLLEKNIIYTYIYLYVYIYVYMYMYVCMYVCMCACMYINYIYMYVYACRASSCRKHHRYARAA